MRRDDLENETHSRSDEVWKSSTVPYRWSRSASIWLRCVCSPLVWFLIKLGSSWTPSGRSLKTGQFSTSSLTHRVLDVQQGDSRMEWTINATLLGSVSYTVHVVPSHSSFHQQKYIWTCVMVRETLATDVTKTKPSWTWPSHIRPNFVSTSQRVRRLKCTTRFLFPIVLRFVCKTMASISKNKVQLFIKSIFSRQECHHFQKDCLIGKSESPPAGTQHVQHKLHRKVFSLILIVKKKKKKSAWCEN